MADAYASVGVRARLDAEIAELTALSDSYLGGRGAAAPGGRALDLENPAVARLFDPRRRPAPT